MTRHELRCTAPHPTIRGWECRAKITVGIAGTVQFGSELRPGCTEHVCPKCGAVYIVCPVERVA